MTGSPALTEKMQAAVEFIRRTGAIDIEIRYSEPEHEGSPRVWMTIASYRTGAQEVDAALTPERAALRLCERLADGGQCRHCGRPTGLDPDTLDRMPLDRLVCWYQYDPELKRFRRGCEGDAP